MFDFIQIAMLDLEQLREGLVLLIPSIRVLALLVIGVPITYFVSGFIGRVLKKRKLNEHTVLLIKKLVFFTGFTFIGITALYEMGFNLTAILGAAGVASVAIGFASQTSLSNIISGIFLYWEKPFMVGDIIRIGDTSGVVISIDTMSVKLRQFDNQFVRIPNENILKTQVTNVTRFPIRRMDLNIGVAYKEDVAKVITILKDVADKNPYCLDEPEPIVVFKDFGESSLNFMMGVWFEKSQFLLLKNSIMQDIKMRFDVEGIEIPFPHRTLYVGSNTDPFPVTVISGQNPLR